MIPTEITSIEKIAAAIGVPNKAEKAALMPHIIMVFLSVGESLNIRPKPFPMAPPI